MLLSDNGYPVLDFLPKLRPVSTFFEKPTESTALSENLATATSSNHQQVAFESTVSTPITQTSSQIHPTHGSPVYGTGDKSFTPEDVVILFKTGATSLWRRVPMHLSTSFANKTMTPNVVFYSDHADSIASYPIIDVLANVSTSLKQSADFELYRKLPSARSSNIYLESATMEGDSYLPGGWRLDKYKFLPLAAHAAAQHPGKKWYIYMEDDNYYFWHSLYTWLGANFSPSDPLYLGSPGAKLGEDFAHGGSGFVISGAALSQTFGSDPELASKYEDYARQHCCGDQVLSHVMAQKGVPRYRKYDFTSFIGLQALPAFRMGFGQWNWCSPLFNVHKVHQADISRLHEFENDFHLKKGYSSDAVMDWSYLFRHFVAPGIFNRNSSEFSSELSISDDNVLLEEWDNFASEKRLSSDITTDEHLTEEEREKKPWFSAEACRKACEDWHLCLSWKFQDDNCGLSSTVSAGLKADEGVRMVSGYMNKKIRGLVDKGDCERSQYIPV